MYRHSIFQGFKVARCCQRSVHSCAIVSPKQQARGFHCNTFLRKDAVAVPSHIKPGFLKQVVKRVGWLDHSKSILKASGYILYENVADKIPYFKFFQEFDMSDTFYSWFLVTELHVWMLMVRTMAEGEEGRYTRNSMIEAMWQDVSTRAKKLEPANPSAVRLQLHEMSEQFQAAMISYDEGLLRDDKVLAGALWRRFFQRNCNEPEHIERLIHYVRQQVIVLDEMARDKVLLKPNITWIDIPKPFGT